MYGFNVIYPVKTNTPERARAIVKRKTQEDIPTAMDYYILGASTLGRDEEGAYLSTQVRVAFPDHDSEDTLPDRDTLFPSAESVGYLAVEEVADDGEE